MTTGDSEWRAPAPPSCGIGCQHLDDAHVGVVIHDPDGSIVDANDRACELLGLTADQLTGRTSMDPRWRAVDAEGRPAPGDRHPAMVALREGHPVRAELLGVQVPGAGLRWLSVTAVPLRRDDDSGVGGVVALFRDVTAVSSADPALRLWERRFRTVMEYAPVGLAVVGLDGRTIRANKRFCHLLGATEATLQSVPLVQVLAPGDADAEQWWVQVCRAGSPGPVERELRLDLPGGPRVVRLNVTAVPAPVAGERELVVTGVDVTGDILVHDQLVSRAVTDDLTGVLRLAALRGAGQRLLSLGSVGVLFIDVDGFKGVNDRFGHATGDSALVAVVDAITETIRLGDVVGRTGGDEFVVVTGSRLDPEGIAALAQRILERAAGRLLEVVGEPVSVSVGAVLSWPGEVIEDVVARADGAMYQAKTSGGGRWVVRVERRDADPSPSAPI